MGRVADRSKTILSCAQFTTVNSLDRLSGVWVDVPEEEISILRMLIKGPDSDTFKRPAYLSWIDPIIQMAHAYQRDTIKVTHPFCYLTIRSKGTNYKALDEWHVDGFSTRISHLPEQNYVWTNINPTEYTVGSVGIPGDFDPLRHNINKYLANRVDNMTKAVMEPCSLYYIDPYILHRRPENARVERTFIRISFVPIEIRDMYNSSNPTLQSPIYRTSGVAFRDSLLDYDEERKKK